MDFRSVTGKHDFTKDVLTKDFPSYLTKPLTDWAYEVLDRTHMISTATGIYRQPHQLLSGFRSELQLLFRRKFLSEFNEFITQILSDPQLTADFIGLCLQNFARLREANHLDSILQKGGSGWKVVGTDKNADRYTDGAYDLEERVPSSVAIASQKALAEDETLQKAWTYCYSRNPDYTKTVIECQNVLEELLRGKYEPKNLKPQLGKLIANLRVSPSKLHFKGDTVLHDKTVLLQLVDNVPVFRNMHTAGTGKEPTRDEAEYILHSTIYIWSMHQ